MGPASASASNGVVFVAPVDAEWRPSAGAVPAHPVASVRLRALLPARTLAETRPVVVLPPGRLAVDPALSALGRLDAVIVGKLVTTGDLLRTPALVDGLLDRLAATAARHPLIVDICDHLPAQGEVDGSTAPVRLVTGLGALGHLTVPTRALADALGPFARRGISVIEDPYEGPAAPARAPRPTGPLHLAWFGLITAESAGPLTACIDRIAQGWTGRALALEIVANPSAAPGVAAIARAHAGRIAIAMTPWSPEALARALDRADLVLLPQDTKAPWARVKSHNRLVETIRAGRLAIAAPIDAYAELADHAWVGEDVLAGLDWALAHPAEARARIVAGQAAIETRFSPAAVGRRWAGTIAAVARGID